MQFLQCEHSIIPTQQLIQEKLCQPPIWKWLNSQNKQTSSFDYIQFISLSTTWSLLLYYRHCWHVMQVHSKAWQTYNNSYSYICHSFLLQCMSSDMYAIHSHRGTSCSGHLSKLLCDFLKDLRQIETCSFGEAVGLAGKTGRPLITRSVVCLRVDVSLVKILNPKLLPMAPPPLFPLDEHCSICHQLVHVEEGWLENLYIKTFHLPLHHYE